MTPKHISRRTFLTRSAGAAAVFTIVPRHVLGGPGQTVPSDVITRAVIGTGGQGMAKHVITNVEGKPPIMLAVCDVDAKHLASAMTKAERGCERYSDFRRVLDRKDIDTIHIATPPHWHSLISIAAAESGRDVLCEKPMHKFIAEGQAVMSAIERTKRMFQIGTYGRFSESSQQLRRLVASGKLGSPLTVRISPAQGYNWKVKEWSGRTNLQKQDVPQELDYDFWLGPAPVKPYNAHRVHASFRCYWDYDGGGLADMGEHFLDPVQYWLGKDNDSPVEVEADAPPADDDAVGMWGEVRLGYSDGTRLIFTSGEWGTPPNPEAPFIEGPKGRIFYTGDKQRKLRSDPDGLLDQLNEAPEPPKLVSFEEAVKSRQMPGGNEKVSHRSACLLHLANAAIRTGRKLRFNSDTFRFINDDAANALADQPMRAPWKL